MTHSLQEQWKEATKIFKRSVQVETWVGPPQVAPPMSCGLKPKRKRASPIKVRLSETEKEIVKKKAREADLSVNAFIKCIILGSHYDSKLRVALLMVNRELTAQGRNLNQIAKHLNSGTATSTQGVAMLDAIRVPLVRSLSTLHKTLTHGAHQP